MSKFTESKNNEQVQDLKEQMKERAEKIVFNLMPKKIIQLSALFKKIDENIANTSEPIVTDLFSIESLGKVRSLDLEHSISELKKVNEETEEHQSKKRKADEAIDDSSDIKKRKSDIDVPCNKLIVKTLKVIKMEILQLIEYCNAVKIWIQLNIPRIEDGNNFGVSIQEDSVSELSRAEDSGFNILESITKYYVTRGKLVSKIMKYPNIYDYRESVVELDQKEYVSLKLCCADLRNNYAILHDVITKNWEKIKKPRSTNNTANMY